MNAELGLQGQLSQGIRRREALKYGRGDTRSGCGWPTRLDRWGSDRRSEPPHPSADGGLPTGRHDPPRFGVTRSRCLRPRRVAGRWRSFGSAGPDYPDRAAAVSAPLRGRRLQGSHGLAGSRDVCIQNLSAGSVLRGGVPGAADALYRERLGWCRFLAGVGILVSPPAAVIAEPRADWVAHDPPMYNVFPAARLK